MEDRYIMTRPLVLGVILYAFSVPASAQTVHHLEPAGFVCPSDQKVWVNTRSGIFHLAGERYYGSTKQGKYICEKAAKAEGDRETRNGQ